MKHSKLHPTSRLWLLAALVLLTTGVESYAAKKDFKGLFGSYRREQYIENEANSTSFGMDFMLSTLLPVSPFIKSEESTRGNPGDDLQYATFFNLEVNFFFTLGYNWEIFASLGYFTYETRKENSVRQDPALPLFHEFQLTAFPVLGGIKYRFSESDIVPYIGAGAGIAQVIRRASYDYNATLLDKEIKNNLVAQFILGLEFFISPSAGIRLEASAYYMNLEQRTFDTGATPGTFPIFIHQAKPVSFRYASGIFVLF